MLKNDSVASYLGRFTHIKDNIVAVGEIVDPNSMARKILNNFTKPLGPFVRGIIYRDILPTCKIIWDDFV